MSAFGSSWRVQLLTLAAAGLAVATMTVGCTAAAAPSPTKAVTRVSSQAAAATTPRYFLDIVQFSGAVSGGELQVRRAATGALVQQPPILALGAAPLGASAEFVVARLAGNRCASTLYRTRISGTGHLGPLTRLGPMVHGEVVSLAAASDGRTIGYFAWPCSKSASGYLAILNVRTGQVRRWGDVSVEGSTGDITVGGDLSLSADGRLALFSGVVLDANAVHTEQRVWALSTSARAGTLEQRSRVVLTRPAASAALDSVLLSPDGRSFYLCAVSTKVTGNGHRPVTQNALITARKTATGAITRTVAKLIATGVTLQGEDFGCPMASAPDGRYLLVPYQEKYATSSETGPLIRAERLEIATRSAAQISFRLPGSAGMSVASGISVAW